MTEPRRWLEDEISPELKALLEAGSASLQLPTAVKNRVGRRVAGLVGASLGAVTVASQVAAQTANSGGAGTMGVAAGASTATGSAAAGSGGLLAGWLVKGALAVMVGTGATVAGLQVDAARPSAHPPSVSTLGAALPNASQPLPLPTLIEAPGPVATPAIEAEPVLSPEKLPPVATEKAPRPVYSTALAPAHTVEPRAPQRSNSALQSEVSELRAARAALATEPARALRLIREHARAYPISQLVAERQLLELRALLALGERGRAEALGKQIISSTSARIYHERVAELLGTH